MMARKIGVSIAVMVSVMTFSGGMAYSGKLMALPPVHAAYPDKHMPIGWWINPKVVEEGR